MSWIITHSGKKFDLFNPDPKTLDIEDIAHALSNLCRFAGHTRTFYSVAQHCCECVQRAPIGTSHAILQDILMHDASEAYIVDVPRPLKHLLPDYLEIESNLTNVIALRYDLLIPMPYIVKEIDNRMLFTERRDLMPDVSHRWSNEVEPFEGQIMPMSPQDAKKRFLEMAKFLEIK